MLAWIIAVVPEFAELDSTRFAKFPEYRFRNFVDIRLYSRLRCCERSYNFPLALACDLAIISEGRQWIIMSDVLAPCFELFWGLADLLTKLDESISEAVRVEIRKASIGESFAENQANGRGAAPMITFQPRYLKLASLASRHERGREKWIVIAP